MKKNLTKKLMLSVLTLAFAVVSLGASTFAWFTLSKDAQVDAFEMEVKGGAGLEIQAISMDTQSFAADGWQTASLDASFIKELIKTVKLDSVTPKNEFTSSKATFTGVTGKETIAANSYVEFKLGLRLSDQGDTNKYPIYLSNYTLETVESTAKEWYANKVYTDKNGATVELNDPKTYYVADAARLAVYCQNGETTVNKIYEDRKLDAEGKVVANTHAEHTSGFQNNGALSYYNAVNETDLTIDNAVNKYTHDSFTEKVRLGTLTGLVAADPDGVIDDRQVVTIVVRIWVEGWDGEAINAIFEQTLKASLNFYLDTDNPTA